TDDQALSLAAGNILTLEDGGTVDLTPFLDNTDDQAITAFSLDNGTNELTLTLEDGGTQTVDFTTVLAAAGTDDQSLSLAAGNILTLEDGGTVDLTPFLDNTDDQAITAFSLDNGTNELTLTLEDGGTQTVDFTTVLAAAGTDDQALSLAAGNILTLEDGGTVDLTPFLDNTDDQAITAFSLDNGTNELTLTLEDGGTQTVDFTTVLAAAGTDDQTASEVSIADAGGNFTATDVEGALSELAAGSTDDQSLSLAAGNILTLEDGGTVDLTPFLDNTDDQAITAFSLDNGTNELTLTLEDGGTQTVDFTTVLAAAGTDDQALSLAAGNILTLEDGGTVDLTPFLDNTDDQAITAFSLDSGTNELTLTLEDGGTQTVDFTTVLAAAGTDDQALSLAAGNILTLEDGGTVDLTPFLDNTDDQAITAFSLDNGTNELTLTLEDGGTQTVDFTTVLAAAGTDDQALSLAAGNILTLEDGGTVDLTPFLDNTDDQAITAFSLDSGTNELTLTLEDGGTQTVDFTTVLAAAGTDDQNLTEVLAEGADANGTTITNLGTPSGPSDAATKAYVDAIADDDLAVTNTIAGNRIATLNEPGGVSNVDIDETVTSMSQNAGTGQITYTKEGGGTDTANVVGAESDNMISTGSNGGAYLAAMPTIYAAGKILGDGTIASSYGINTTTSGRANEGDYNINFSNALGNTNYIIQLTVLDCGGNCPPAGGSNYDDPGISYYGQTGAGFNVNIGDSDNGATPKDDIDLEFMFTVIVLPN
uniref:beta strand repeat-containing protein n=1 Tax=Croceivirga lutea TaxID=1775167 RepID=UPI0019D52E9E